jgi:lysophospholipase L1-like esterase
MSVAGSTLHTWLALGDSYTVGESVEPPDRYPVQAAKMLGDAGFYFSEPEIIARTGWTANELLKAVNEKKIPFLPYDLVSLLIGVNDQYQGGSLAEYREEFKALLLRSIQMAGGNPARVIVLSIPDYSVTPYARNSEPFFISRQIDSFNEANKELAERYSLHYINITEESRKAAVDPALIAGDGLHYSGKEYAVWARLLVSRAREILK